MEWKSVLDENGNTYYCNEQTGETSWEIPKVDTGQWNKTIGEDGREYYVNSATLETRWDDPMDETIAADLNENVAGAAVDVLGRQKKAAYWVEVFDPESEQNYYCHSTTNEVVWEQPESYVLAMEDKVMCSVITIQCKYRSIAAKRKVMQTRETLQNLWIEIENGKCYYNTETNEVQYVMPRNYKKGASPDEVLLAKIKRVMDGLEMKKDKGLEGKVAAAKLTNAEQGVWIAVYDPVGKCTYYYNKDTKETTNVAPETFVESFSDQTMAAVIKIQCAFRTRKARKEMAAKKEVMMQKLAAMENKKSTNEEEATLSGNKAKEEQKALQDAARKKNDISSQEEEMKRELAELQKKKAEKKRLAKEKKAKEELDAELAAEQEAELARKAEIEKKQLEERALLEKRVLEEEEANRKAMEDEKLRNAQEEAEKEQKIQADRDAKVQEELEMQRKQEELKKIQELHAIEQAKEKEHQRIEAEKNAARIEKEKVEEEEAKKLAYEAQLAAARKAAEDAHEAIRLKKEQEDNARETAIMEVEDAEEAKRIQIIKAERQRLLAMQLEREQEHLRLVRVAECKRNSEMIAEEELQRNHELEELRKIAAIKAAKLKAEEDRRLAEIEKQRVLDAKIARKNLDAMQREETTQRKLEALEFESKKYIIHHQSIYAQACKNTLAEKAELKKWIKTKQDEVSAAQAAKRESFTNPVLNPGSCSLWESIAAAVPVPQVIATIIYAIDSGDLSCMNYPKPIAAEAEPIAPMEEKKDKVSALKQQTSYLKGLVTTLRRPSLRPSFREPKAAESKIEIVKPKTPAQLQESIINRRNPEGDTLLHVAAFAGCHDTVSYLISLGSNVNAIDSTVTKSTPLHVAVTGQHLGVVQVLLAAGASTTAIDTSGDTPLHAACRRNNVHLVQALLSAESSTESAVHIKNYKNKTPYDLAKQFRTLAVLGDHTKISKSIDKIHRKKVVKAL